jgi:hypothetical protein
MNLNDIDDINKIHQDFTLNLERKLLYGEIFTPFKLINEMFDMFPENLFLDKDKKWLDAGAGTGYFSIALYFKLFKFLSTKIPDESKRQRHIIENMIYMSEIQEDNITRLKEIFGEKANIIPGDFLQHRDKYDFIIGNPPYNCNGIKKVPTNQEQSKKMDGKTIWMEFIRHSIDLLRENGNLLVIIPSIWMKPDKEKMYNFITKYKVQKLKCLTNTETNKIFNNQAQTPTCYFWLSKQFTDNSLYLYDRSLEKYVSYTFDNDEPLPVYGSSVISKIKKYIKSFGYLDFIKTNLPNKHISLQDSQDIIHKYKNIHTTVLSGEKRNKPTLVFKYSSKPLQYYGIKKLIMAHKMYGFPYIDYSGSYGISNRDNYVYLSENNSELEKLRNFFSTKTALFLFECTRYRMKYLEKYIFYLIPNILKLPNFPEKITDETIADYFNFDLMERKSINTLHKTNYDFLNISL